MFSWSFAYLLFSNYATCTEHQGCLSERKHFAKGQERVKLLFFVSKHFLFKVAIRTENF